MTLKSVRVIHNIITRNDFNFLAEFFRLAGIYVVECIDNDEDESPYQNAENCFEVTIDTCGSEKASELDSALDFGAIKETVNTTGNIRHWTQGQQVTVLQTVLTDIALLLRKTPPGNVWSILIREYVAADLMLHSLNLQYYYKRPSFAVENARDAFDSLASTMKSSLENIAVEDQERKYLEYAYIYSKVKVNAGCKYMEQKFKFPIEELADEGMACCNNYPDFSNLKVLLGLCYEHEPAYAQQAVRAFVRALEEENEYCYASHIYYWIGKQYETRQANWEDSVENYRASYVHRHKYKNKYKLAIAQRVDGDYEESINSFKWIIDKLEEKIKLSMLDPLELEYYFKSKAMIAIIYFNDLKNYLGAIEHGEYLIKTYNHLVDSDNFYIELYGVRAGSYRDLTKQRFDLRRVRSILYYSYHYLGLEEKALQYMNMEDF